MERDINIMNDIQQQKEKDIERARMKELDPEGETMGEHKRFTFDLVDVPSDPLR